MRVYLRSIVVGARRNKSVIPNRMMRIDVAYCRINQPLTKGAQL